MIAIKHGDGTQSEIYEIGDRVKVIRVDSDDEWLVRVGDLATVKGYLYPKETPSVISHLLIRTDAMVRGNWGVYTTPSWCLESI